MIFMIFEMINIFFAKILVMKITNWYHYKRIKTKKNIGTFKNENEDFEDIL